MDIDGWRQKIDELNSKLVELLNERARFAVEVGKLKRQKNLPVHDPQRENHILEKIAALNKGPLSNRALRMIFEVIIQENRRIEESG